MELLIPGLILVALMAYASTRIKRSAAEAFDAETVETDEFIVQKPAGFLNVLNRDPKFAFEAYSKDFGVREEKDIRAATAHLRTYEEQSVDDRLQEIRSSKTEISEELNEVINDIRYHVMEGSRTKGESTYRIWYKLAARENKVYELEVAALALPAETMQKAEAMFDSFQLK
jgi:hypothetical protein